MQNVTALKTRGQDTLSRLVEVGKQQPAEVQTWGAAAAGAVVGGLVVAASAQAVLAIVTMLAAPPVALTIGALGGGAVAWSFMQNRVSPSEPESGGAASLVNGDGSLGFAHAEGANA
ncbi:MAG: hypothetical protein NT075_03960 [Chloroflexi bacterium]|nr:hypothetical protein [Chloroflexota bacterium]